MCLFLCVSVMVLAADTWSASASGFHLLHLVTDADVLSLPRDPTESGAPASVVMNLLTHTLALSDLSVFCSKETTLNL